MYWKLVLFHWSQCCSCFFCTQCYNSNFININHMYLDVSYLCAFDPVRRWKLHCSQTHSYRKNEECNIYFLFPLKIFHIVFSHVVISIPESEWERVQRSKKQVHGRDLSTSNTTVNHIQHFLIIHFLLKPLWLIHWIQLLMYLYCGPQTWWLQSHTKKPASADKQLSLGWKDRR